MSQYFIPFYGCIIFHTYAIFCLFYFLFFKYILLIMLLQLSHYFLPFIPLCPALPLPLLFPYLSSCPWVIHISYLASPFPTLFFTSPCLFCTYHLCFLFPVPFPPSSPLITLHVISISVILFLFYVFA